MAEAFETTLSSLLGQHEHALVAAIDGDGLFVPLPTTFDAGNHHEVRARSALELVDPSEWHLVIETWARAKELGFAKATAKLKDGAPMSVYLFDLRAVHGTFIGVFLVDGQPDSVAALETREPVPPRIGRVRKDEMAMIRSADRAIVRILGWDLDQLEGMRSLELVHPDDQDRAVESWMEMLTAPGGVARWRGRHIRRDGSTVWMEVTNHNHLHDEIGAVVCDMVDISDEMAAVEALREREQVLARLTEALPLGVLHVDPGGRIRYANERVHDLVGRDPAATLDEQLAGVIPDDRPAFDAAMHEALTLARDTDIVVRIRVPNLPQLNLFSISFRALLGPTGDAAGAVVCVADVTEATELRIEMERRATTDALTGCLNRAAIIDTLDRTLASRSSTSSGTAVVFLDLDGFKEVNDSYGHRAGDHVLVDAAVRLRSAMREGDALGRFGGDEFLVVLPNVGTAEQAMVAGRRIAEAVSCAVMAEGEVVSLRASVGVAWTSSPSADGDALITAADRAMYESKRTDADTPVAAHLV